MNDSSTNKKPGDDSTEQIRQWGQIVSDGGLKCPHGRVVALLNRVLSHGEIPETDARALDVGCGTGRHTKFLADLGFDSIGLDVSQASIDAARKLFSGHPGVEFRKGDIASMDCNETKYHVVVCWGVIFLEPLGVMREQLTSLYRCMTPSSWLIVNFRGKDSWFHGLGDEENPGTYLLDERANDYEGLRYTFLDRQEAEKLLDTTGFEVIFTERNDLWKNGAQDRHSWWYFAARKTE